jgi:prepilin-type N-terminal cleavage/methylation domain-containing protein
LDMQSRSKCRAGFSLVEVSLAMMIISIGMITLFGLFPTSMKQGEAAYRDTHGAQFAQYALNGLRANFASASNFAEWSDDGTIHGLSGLGISATVLPDTPATPVQFEYPIGSGMFVRYILELTPPGGDSMNWRAAIWVWSGAYGPSDVAVHKRRSRWFSTEIFYGGVL